MSQKYLPGGIIRNKQTGKPLLVIHVYRVCTIVVDLSEGEMPIPRILLERDYPNWVNDTDMECKEKKG